MRWFLRIFGVFLIVVVVFMLGPRVQIDTRTEPTAIRKDLDGFVKQQEDRYKDLRPNTQKLIRWYDPKLKTKTPLAIVYFHGFSASRQEIEPVPSMLAQTLKANVFFTRLRGHGRSGDAMAEASVQAWLQDAHDALIISRAIGEKTILIGSSTGATLALWLAAQPFARDAIAANLLLSPNLGPKNAQAEILLWPWGGQIARLIQGKRRSWKPATPAQGLYWTTDYPTEALLPMMALVKLARDIDPKEIKQPTAILYSPKDTILNTRYIEALFPALPNPHKKLIPFPKTTDPASHILAGDALSPSTNQPLHDLLAAFVKTRP